MAKQLRFDFGEHRAPQRTPEVKPLHNEEGGLWVKGHYVDSHFRAFCIEQFDCIVTSEIARCWWRFSLQGDERSYDFCKPESRGAFRVTYCNQTKFTGVGK